MPFDMIRKKYPSSRQSIKHAEAALPILVYYATVLKRPITYSELASLLKTYCRVLGRPLGLLGRELQELRKRWHQQEIPMIQFLVIKKGTDTPGVGGLNWLLGDLLGWNRRKVPKNERLSAVETYRGMIFKYDKWDSLLKEFKLKPYRPLVPNLKTATERLNKKYGHGKGESMAHRRLKHYVSQNPHRLRLSGHTKLHCVEFEYPSMDRADVLFRNGPQWIAVEVKPKDADQDEITRGIYQCVKYDALSHALMVGEGKEPLVRSMLVLEGTFPPALEPLRKALQLKVVEQVKVPQGFKLPPHAQHSAHTPDEQD